jgi:hypothetical protein
VKRRILKSSPDEIRYDWLKKVNSYEVKLNEIQDRYLATLDTCELGKMYAPLVEMTSLIYRNHYLHNMPRDSIDVVPHELASYVISRFQRDPIEYQIYAWYKIIKTYLLRFKDEYIRNFNPRDHISLDSGSGFSSCRKLSESLILEKRNGVFVECGKVDDGCDSDNESRCDVISKNLPRAVSSVELAIKDLGSLVGYGSDSLTRNLIKLSKDSSIRNLIVSKAVAEFKGGFNGRGRT